MDVMGQGDVINVFWQTVRLTGIGMSGIFTVILLFFLLVKGLLVLFPVQK